MIIYIRHWTFALLLTLELIVFMLFVTAPYDYSNFKPIYCIQLYKRPYGSRIIANQPTAWKVTLKLLKIYKSAHYSSSGSNLFTHVTRPISQLFLATPACSSDIFFLVFLRTSCSSTFRLNHRLYCNTRNACNHVHIVITVEVLMEVGNLSIRK